MPLLVSHDTRRAQVVAAASGILARGGISAVTVRDVARATGFSTAVVSHYFRNKQELLHLVFERNIFEAIEAAHQAGVRSGGDLKAYVETSMVLDQASADRWRIWLAYIAQVMVEPDIAVLQRVSMNDRVDQLTGVLDRLAARGDLLDDLDRPLAARRLLAFVVGLAIQAMVDPAGWPPARQHALIDAELAPLYRLDRVPASVRCISVAV